MKKLTLTVGLAFAFTFMLFWAQDAKLPSPEAGALWKYISEESPYTQWEFWPEHQGMLPGSAPHGPYHKIYVNHTLAGAHGKPVPYGSIQVKESFNEAKKLVAITVMYKVKGFNPEAGDWYWARYSPEGRGGPAGKVQMCIDCHRARADNDFLFVHDIK